MTCHFNLHTLHSFHTLFVSLRIRAGKREFAEQVRKVCKVCAPVAQAHYQQLALFASLLFK